MRTLRTHSIHCAPHCHAPRRLIHPSLCEPRPLALPVLHGRPHASARTSVCECVCACARVYACVLAPSVRAGECTIVCVVMCAYHDAKGSAGLRVGSETALVRVCERVCMHESACMCGNVRTARCRCVRAVLGVESWLRDSTGARV